MTEPDQQSVEAQASELLREVLSGERVLLRPPGGFVTGLLIPSMAPVCYSVSWLLVASVSNLGSKEASSSLFLWPFGLSVLLAIALVVSMTRALLGHPSGRDWVIRMVRTLTVLGVGLSCWALLEPNAYHRTIGVMCLIGLVPSNLLARSRSLLTFSSFMALKRRYELERKAKVDAIMAGGRTRQRTRRR